MNDSLNIINLFFILKVDIPVLPPMIVFHKK